MLFFDLGAITLSAFQCFRPTAMLLRREKLCNALTVALITVELALSALVVHARNAAQWIVQPFLPAFHRRR